MVRSLGIRYLWIDALCIVQDGDDGRDWAEQAADMAKIYQGGLLNISAVDGNSCGSGLTPKPFQGAGMRIGRADYVERPVRRGTMNSATGAELVFLGHPPSAFSGLDSDKRKLSTRGWAFQEQLVSPATIHYTNWGMVWECCSDIKSERT